MSPHSLASSAVAADAFPLLDAARDAASSLRSWLLHGPAQLRDGEQIGGVAGTIGVDGHPLYVYAEITGYYLSWLADIAGVESEALVRERAQCALDWAAYHFAAPGDTPQTRIHLTVLAPDWRNNAVFFFDLAMLVRGIDAVAETGLATPPDTLRRALHEHLQQFVVDGALRPTVQTRGTHALPPRWSTLGGPFLVKASSRVAWSARHAALPEALALACENESERWAAQAAEIDLAMLHPTLYFAEGLLLSRPDRADAIAQLLHRCLATVRDDGSLPETASEPNGKVRNDILAQALRVGLLLRELGANGAPAQAELDRLASTLIARIDSRGFLPFNTETAAQANVWGTMFAEQALRWYADPVGVSRPRAAALV